MTLNPSELAAAIRRVQAHKVTNRATYFEPYPWQTDFYLAGHTNRQRLLMAANRVGKTYSAAFEVYCHLTGNYPDWWEGVVFDFAPDVWALGVTGEQIRDVLQSELFGKYSNGQFDGSGLINGDCILDVTPAVGTPRLVKEVSVKHKTGGRSNLGFRAYSQGQHVLMGSSKDFIWIDEEPEDPEIYPQCLTRTATGNQGKGGYVMMTFTPENGMTELVTQYMEAIQPGQYLQNVTWSDAPHLTEETKTQLLAAFPDYQREMRTKGIPVLGEGMIYPIAEDRVKCEPFEIPAHYKRVAAIDFGIDHPTTGAWIAYDADSDVMYLYDTYKLAGEVPAIHSAAFKAKGESIPIIYPHDGDNTEKGSGQTLAEKYREHGCNMHIRFTNPDGTNHVEPGIMELLERMRTGRFKVFDTQEEWFKEFRKYHRKNGKRVKVDDDLMDATRYAAISVGRFGVQGGGSNPIKSYRPSVY